MHAGAGRLAGKVALITGGNQGIGKAIATRFVTEGARVMIVAPHILSEFLENILVDRAGAPQDVANATLFLASDEASFITGHHLYVDGGQFNMRYPSKAFDQPRNDTFAAE